MEAVVVTLTKVSIFRGYTQLSETTWGLNPFSKRKINLNCVTATSKV
jgi:hypothetical protein